MYEPVLEHMHQQTPIARQLKLYSSFTKAGLQGHNQKLRVASYAKKTSSVRQNACISIGSTCTVTSLALLISKHLRVP